MKVLRAKPELCKECFICEEVCSTNITKEKTREKSAISIVASADETGAVSIVTCDQCGKCIDICPVGAIYRSGKGIVLIKKSICVGCYSCVGFCPVGAMKKHDDIDEPYKCIACGKCVKECTEKALLMEESSEQ